MASSHLLLPPPCAAGAFPRTAVLSFPASSSLAPLPKARTRGLACLFVARAKGKSTAQGDPGIQRSKNANDSNQSAAAPVAGARDEEEEVEEDLPWIQEKALDLVEFTGTVTQAIPGPRVGQSNLPWMLAVPLAYVGLSFVVAFVKTIRKFTSPRAQKRRQVYRNAMLLKSIDELFMKGSDVVQQSALKGLMQETGFSMEDILRKYIRYALNEKPFNPELVVDLIHLRKASKLEDPEVAEVLNEVSRRIVKEKGPVVMDISGFTERGFKLKLAVQALFSTYLRVLCFY